MAITLNWWRKKPQKTQHHHRNGKTVWTAVRKTFFEFTEMTKVNGMFYLRESSTQGFSRFIWALIPVLLLSFGAFLVVSLWRRYLESPTRMTIATPLLSIDVPFPGITVCHPQSILDYKSVEFANRIKYPSDVTKEMLLDALPAMAILTEHQWTTPNLADVQLVNNVLRMNNISVLSAIMQLGTTCDDFIIKCRWAGKEFPCFQEHEYLTWTTSTSHLGVCCSFNYHPNNIEYIPFASNTFGLDGGLTIIGTGYPQTADGKSGVLFSAGFVSLIHHPNDFAVESAPTTLLATGRETFVAIYPTDSRCASQVLELPQSQRNCINAADYINMDAYRQPACTLECLRDSIHQECKCHPYHLPQLINYGRQKPLKECTVLDALCFVENYSKFKTLKCDCLPSCSDVTYKISSFVTTPSAANYSVSSLYKLTNLTDFEFIAHFYIANQLVSANKRIVVMSWITLLSNLGGVFNLCLGISVISLIEVLYFVVVRLRFNVNAAPFKVHPKIVQVLQLTETNAKWQDKPDKQ